MTYSGQRVLVAIQQWLRKSRRMLEPRPSPNAWHDELAAKVQPRQGLRQGSDVIQFFSHFNVLYLRTITNAQDAW